MRETQVGSLGLGRSPGEGNGDLLQHSCLENSQGQWSLVGYSPRGPKQSDITEQHTHTHTHLSPVTCNGSLVGTSRTEVQAWHPGMPTPGPNVILPADKPWPDSPDLLHPKPWDESLGRDSPAAGELTLWTLGVLRLRRRCRALVESASLTVTACKFENDIDFSSSDDKRNTCLLWKISKV